MQNPEKSVLTQNFRAIRGTLSIRGQENNVARLPNVWGKDSLQASEHIYKPVHDKVFGRLDHLRDNTESRRLFDDTSSMAEHLYGPWAENPQNRLFEAAVIFTAAGYFLDDDNDQVKDPEVLGKKAQLFLDGIKKIFAAAIAHPEEAMHKFAHDQMMHPGDKSYMLASAAADMMGIVRLHSSVEFATLFKDALLEHWIASFSSDKNKIPATVEEYIEERRKKSGMKPTIMLAELIAGITLSDELRQRLEVATFAVADFGGLLNDILSAPKEIIDEESAQNLVRVIEIRENKTTAEAFERAFQIVDECYLRFEMEMFRLLAQRDLSDDDIETVKKYQRALEQVLWASVYWQLYTNRYRHGVHPVAEFVKDEEDVA